MPVNSDTPVEDQDDSQAQPRPARGAPSGPNRVGRGAAPRTVGFHPFVLFGIIGIVAAIIALVVIGLLAIAPKKSTPGDAISALPPSPIQPTVSQDKDFYQKHDNAILVQRQATPVPGSQGGQGQPRTVIGPDGRPIVDPSFGGPGSVSNLASGPSGGNPLGLASAAPRGGGVQPLTGGGSGSATGAGRTTDGAVVYRQVPVETVTPVPHDPSGDFASGPRGPQVPAVLPAATARQQFPGQASLSQAAAATGYGDAGREGPTEITLGDGSNAPVVRASPSVTGGLPQTGGGPYDIAQQAPQAGVDQTLVADDTSAAARRRHDILGTQNETYDTPFVVQSGTFIPAILITGIDSELPGLVIAQVSQPVYDSYSHSRVLIPAKTRLIGAYKNAVGLGGSRVLLGWDRMLYPNNTYRDLIGMEGAGRQGQSGVSGRVDSHRGKAFGSMGLYTLLSLGAAMATQQANQVRFDARGNALPPTPAQQAEAQAVSQLLSVGSSDLQRQLSQPPTVHVDPGTRVFVIVDHDMTYATPYRP